jgi:hypothetical protein
MTSWTYGGTALTTYGRVTLFSDSYDFIERRNENILLPFQHGRSFVEKYFEERILSFVIKYQGATFGALETINDSLKQKLSPRTLQTLAQTREDTTVRNVQAIVDRPLQMDLSHGNNIALFVVEFTLPFPFFRLSTEITSNETTINASPKAMVVTNPGTVEERDATIVLTGPLLNTVITNSTNGNTLTYTGTIASPRIVTIQKSGNEWIATNDLGTNVIGNITHTGASTMMVFDPGTNNLSITDGTATTGKVRVRFYAPFI